jgi:hypothetical protein
MLVTALVAAPAFAQNHGMGNDRPRPQQLRPSRPPPPPPVHWRNDYRQQGYYRGPDIYYRAPPVVQLPPSSYQPPGLSLNFGFPLYY